MKIIQFELLFKDPNKLEKLLNYGYVKNEVTTDKFFYQIEQNDVGCCAYEYLDEYIKVVFSEPISTERFIKWDDMKEYRLDYIIELANITKLIEIFEEKPIYISFYSLENRTNDIIDSGKWDNSIAWDVYTYDELSYNRPNGCNHFWFQDEDPTNLDNYIKTIESAGFKL